MEAINDLIVFLGGYMWNLVLGVAVFLGVYYGIKTKFVQLKLFPDAVRLVRNKAGEKLADDPESVSGLQALLVTLGGSIGTGNVAGVAIAVSLGGPGAVFWMWFIALFSMAISLIENTLAQVYKTKEGHVYRGGPAYYMEKGLGKRWLGVIYALSMIVSLGFAMGALQANTISLSIGQSMGIPPLFTATTIAVLIGLVIFGGIVRIAKVAEKFVPIMTIIYLLMGLAIIIVNITKVPAVFALIFRSAFTLQAVGGAAIGTVIYNGLKRGVFSNGAGQGDAPTVGASSTIDHPVEQGMMGMVSVFIDTIIVCSITALVVIISGVNTTSELVGIELSQLAFTSVLGNWVGVVLSLAITMFCFTSIMSNYYCGESSIAFLTKGTKGRTTYRLLFVVAVFLGGITGVDLMWNIADLFTSVIFLLNMASLVFLGGLAIKVVDDYIKQKEEGKLPVFNRNSIEELKDIEEWNVN